MQKLNHKITNMLNRQDFPKKIARQVALKPHLNIGVFALEKQTPHWKVWQKT